MINFKNILLKRNVKDLESLELYLQLIEYYINTDLTYSDVYCENHHICPKSMFPEYRTSKWNIVRLPFDDHVEAHRLLCMIFQTGEMKRAYSFISRQNLTEKIKFMTKGAFTGDNNPSKRKDVREKISKNKKGKKRPDLLNQKFFGASKETISNILENNSKRLRETVVVRDINNNKFRVSVHDDRYLSGELVPFNRNVKRNVDTSKKRDISDSIMRSRNKKYEMISKFSFDEIVDYLIDAHNSGKNIFKEGKLFGSNYIMLINKTKFDRKELYDSVVQQLSKVPNK